MTTFSFFLLPFSSITDKIYIPLINVGNDVFIPFSVVPFNTNLPVISYKKKVQSD